MKKVALISLGCAKNLVDSEVMLGVLKRSGFTFVGRPQAADVIIVNTCGFIKPAREEAENALRRALRLKRRDPRTMVVAAGCYVERNRAALEKLFPEVDAWTGVRDFDKIAETIGGHPPRSRDDVFLYSDRHPRVVSTPGTWAYIKISEGCTHRCGFCAIPAIKGPYRSRSLASIVREARALAAQGVKEVNLISHDSTFYGRDRGIREGLAKLIERLTHITGLEWIRVLYGYPEEISEPLLEIMTEPKVCAYLDIPFQHADPTIIRAMGRGMDGPKALALLDRIRAGVPGVAVRTSLIVGFPGEGVREFGRLERFVEKARFDHLGVFPFSPEVGTSAFRLGDPVSHQEKERRRERLMKIQADLALAKNRSYIGSVREILIERRPRGTARCLIGRARFQAPEVDGLVRITFPGIRLPGPAPIVRAEITSAGPYDLAARIVS
jgi:ribosomal protein S12 methylthiotransferase